MASDADFKELRDAIGRGLSSHITVEADVPEALNTLLQRLKLAEWQRPERDAGDHR